MVSRLRNNSIVRSRRIPATAMLSGACKHDRPRAGGRAWGGRLFPLAAFLLGLAVLAFTVTGAAAENTNGLAWQTQVFVDPSRSVTLSEILGQKAGSFAATEDREFNLGYSPDALWLRIEVTSPSPQTAVITLTPNFVDLIDLYIAGQKPGLAATDFLHVPAGDHRPISDDRLAGLGVHIPFQVEPSHPTIIYMRLAGEASALQTFVSVYPIREHAMLAVDEGVFSGLWIGGMACLMAIQIVFYYFEPRRFYILQAVSTLINILLQFGSFGLSHELVFRSGGIGNDLFMGSAVWLDLAATAAAASSILGLRETSRWMFWCFRTAWLIAAAGIFFLIVGRHAMFAPVGFIMTFLLATLAMVHGVRKATTNGLATWLRAGAFVVLWLSLVASQVQLTGFQDVPFWVLHSYPIGTLVQTLLLAGSLGVRLRDAGRVTRRVQEGELIAAREAEHRANALVRERTHQLADAKKVAEDALAAELKWQRQQMRFMEVISHQYRTPLATVQSSIETVALTLPPEDCENRKRLDRARRAIRRLVEIMELNLVRSRLQGPAFRPQLRGVEVGSVVAGAVARVRDFLDIDTIGIAISDAAWSATFQADVDMIELAIINIIENAAKFSPEPSPILITCDVDGRNAVIAVQDQGIGIPAEELAHVQRRFARGSNAAGIAGTGMGLSFVQRVCAAHSGSLSIESTVRKGTTVTLILPLSAEGFSGPDGPSMSAPNPSHAFSGR